MSHQALAPRFTAAAVVLLALLGGNAGKLSGQDAVSASPAPSSGAPAAQASTESATATPVQAGPRVTPPLERYQGTLPRSSGSESLAPDSEGSRHTIVLSTLAIVLIAVIVVLLAT